MSNARKVASIPQNPSTLGCFRTVWFSPSARINFDRQAYLFSSFFLQKKNTKVEGKKGKKKMNTIFMVTSWELKQGETNSVQMEGEGFGYIVNG